MPASSTPAADRRVCFAATNCRLTGIPRPIKRLTDWECAQHLARVLDSPSGGIDAAAQLYSKMAPERGEAARMLAYRLYDICERKDRAGEAQVWNMLAREWPALEAAAVRDRNCPPGTVAIVAAVWKVLGRGAENAIDGD